MSALQPLAIFRTGRHTAADGRDVTITRSDLAAIAASYDAERDAAPLVVGHPEIDAPAFGWVQSVQVAGDTLLAQPHQVDASFAEAVNAGRYRKLSASLYLPDSPGNPKPGQLYLRHVGFLGAAAPAVKGLPPAKFAAAADALTVSFSESLPIYRDPAMPQPIDPTPDPHHDEVKLTQDRAALEARANALAERERALAAREQQAERSGAVEFAERLVDEGRLLPRERAPVVELLLAIPADRQPLSFAEGDAVVNKDARQTLRDLLSNLEPRIQYGRERANTREPERAPVHFAAPANVAVDTDRLELHERAKAWQATHLNASYIDAVRAVGG